jgi:hypothetical protein
MSPLPQRHNFKWNINELLSLQREYQLLEMSIQDISAKHGRTIVSILYRLQQEGFIDTWIDARGYQEFSKTQSYLVGSLDCEEDTTQDDNNQDDDSDYQDEEESDDDEEFEEDEDEEEASITSLNQRVWGIENAVNDIKGMISTLLSRFNISSKPLKKLRQSQVLESI